MTGKPQLPLQDQLAFMIAAAHGQRHRYLEADYQNLASNVLELVRPREAMCIVIGAFIGAGATFIGAGIATHTWYVGFVGVFCFGCAAYLNSRTLA